MLPLPLPLNGHARCQLLLPLAPVSAAATAAIQVEPMLISSAARASLYCCNCTACVIWHTPHVRISGCASCSPTCHLFYCGHSCHNSAMLRQLVSAQGKCDRQHSGHGNGDTTHNDDQDIGQSGATACSTRHTELVTTGSWPKRPQARGLVGIAWQVWLTTCAGRTASAGNMPLQQAQKALQSLTSSADWSVGHHVQGSP